MRHLYNLLLYILLPFLPLRLLWKSRKNPAYRRRIKERFGYLGIKPLASSIWVHAVSVGEVIAAVPLITELLKQYPNETIVVTTMTPTGADRIQKNFWGRVLQIYVPYDYPFAVKRFLHYTNPSILIIMETELWPNILHYTHLRQVPVILANARLAAKSFAGYQKVKQFTKEMLSAITVIAARSEIDAKRFMALGKDAKDIVVTGNVKFDICLPEDIKSEASLLRERLGKERPIWVAASTHKNEEEKVLAGAKLINKIIPQALLVLVPRHPERFTEVYELCRSKGFNTIRFSTHEPCVKETQVVVADVMGQLLNIYAASDVAFVGGSLIAWGGHNLLEPAVLAKPVISGVNLEAFAEIAELLSKAGALFKVKSENGLAAYVIQLLQDKILRAEYGKRALRVVNEHRGATAKLLNIVKKMIDV
ncbi:MAG: lipid IV(A) 3-deoxy-D-manno-octulosonic acid transferase [Gammaproteobacteria bacterium]|nr:lipid IV(A) 3-deoxy-D-manno-octulosonic acid transferase [Gammaproteobacteria bacterium]